MGIPGAGLNCTARGTNFEPNGDIVGIGVLVAFFATAVATVGAIIYGYLSESFPEAYFNDLDRYAIMAYKKTKVFGTILWLSEACRILKNGLKSRLGLKPSTPSPRLPREIRQEALSRFILTLSDQQLVTGLALLIGAVANQRILSVYEFSVVLSLAWFSSTTHLATLDALREYFLNHEVVRNWRVGGMLALLVLLSYCLFMAMFAGGTLDGTVPVQCYFSLQPSTLADQVVLDPLIGMNIASTAMTLCLLMSGYIVRIRALYIGSHRTGKVMTLGDRLAWWWAKQSNSKSQMRPNFVEVTAEVQSSIRFYDFLYIMECSKSKWKAKWLSSSYQYRHSFLSSMPSIAFSFSYGISQVVCYRWRYENGLSDKSPAIDFGQITPLFLLVLPVLAAAEVYYESRENVKVLASHEKHTTKPEGQTPQALASNQQANTLAPPLSTHEAQRYQEQLPIMKKYFYREIEEIRKEEVAATTPQEHAHIFECQAQLLVKLELFQALEKRIERSLSLIRLGFSLTISIILGITLNIASIEAISIACFIFFIRYASALVGIVASLYRYTKKEKEIILEQAADREFWSMFKEKDNHTWETV